MFALPALAAALQLLWPAAVHAERWAVEASVGSELTYSTNPGLLPGGAKDDTVLELRPRLTLLGEGARLRFGGFVVLNASTYLNNTLPSRVLPEADLNGRLEAVERFLFLEAGVRSLQTASDPFGVRPEAGSPQNTLTTTQTRFTPSIESSVSPNARYRIRSDNTWTRDDSATSQPLGYASSAGYFARHSAFFEQDPRPLGWRIEAERTETRYDDDLRQPLSLELARLSVDYLVATDLSVGLRGGYERTDVEGIKDAGPIYGVQARWQPSERTTASGFYEDRVFGANWRLGLDHRHPQFALNVTLTRGTVSAPQSIFELPATANVTALLDSAFTTRYPDAIERARVVQDFIARQGLPNATLRPTSLYAQQLSLQTSRSANLVLIGVRNTLAFSIFQLKNEDATENTTFSTGSAATNNVQNGAAIVGTHRLSALTGLVASVEWSRIRALDTTLPDRTTQRTARVRVNLQASPKTTAFFGARYRDLDSATTGEGREAAAFVGLDHRF